MLRLAGVTVDVSLRHVKSYLITMPDTRCEPLLHRASRSSITWNQIERWVRRLIQAIHAVHSQGYLVGPVHMQRPPILVDAFANIYLYRFDSGQLVSTITFPFSPPEFRHYAQLHKGVPVHISRTVVIPNFDIYQLGQLLWSLAKVDQRTRMPWQ